MEERMTMTKDDMLKEMWECKIRIRELIRELCSENDIRIMKDMIDRMKELADREALLRTCIEQKLYTDKPEPVNKSLSKEIKRIFGR